MMNANILAIGTAVPQFKLSQKQAVGFVIDYLSLNDVEAAQLRKLYDNTAIHHRHSIIEDFVNPRADWQFWSRSNPGTLARNTIYKTEAPKLAHQAAEKALQEWKGNRSDITHIISVSCTGMIAPGLEVELIRSLGLNQSVNRLGINFMGCFGAFKGIDAARAYAKENPKNRVLVVCTELCSLHFQSDLAKDTVIANAIFADGAAAVVIGASPQNNENALWSIQNQSSLILKDSMDEMRWDACDTGYAMRLSKEVPPLLSEHIVDFIESVLDTKTSLHHCEWAIHPGGKAILEGIEQALELKRPQTQISWDILAGYGNMSSPTFLFVLDALRKKEERKQWCLGLGFGPGLAFEGILLEKKDKGH